MPLLRSSTICGRIEATKMSLSGAFVVRRLFLSVPSFPCFLCVPWFRQETNHGTHRKHGKKKTKDLYREALPIDLNPVEIAERRECDLFSSKIFLRQRTHILQGDRIDIRERFFDRDLTTVKQFRLRQRRST